MTDDHWHAGYVLAFAVRLAGDAIPETNRRGEPIVGDTLLLCFNAHHENLELVLPVRPGKEPWQLVLDTAVPEPATAAYPGGAKFEIDARSMAIFRHATRTKCKQP